MLFAQIINLIFSLLSLLILIRVIISWVNPNPYNQFVRIIYQLTDPILLPFQRLLPPMGGFDLSPIIALLVIDLLRRLLIGLVV